MKRIINLLLIVFLLVSCATKKEETIDYANYDVYVESEFASLKRVILSKSEMTGSKLMFEDAYNTEEELLASGYIKMDGYYYSPYNEELEKNMAKERDALKEILLKYNVEVIEPRDLTEEEKAMAEDINGPTRGSGMTNFFVRDPITVIGNNIIEMNFKKEYRRYEVLTIRDILNTESSKENVKYVSMPRIDISEGLDSDLGPYLEGGDILVYHDKVFVGSSGYASDNEGFNWLKNYLSNFGYEVIKIELQGLILHLDCALSLVREGLLIASMDSLKNGLPDELKDWDVIEVSEEDARIMACNGLPINEEVYITDIAFKDTVGAELEKRGITVEYIDFKYTRSECGSIHCSTNPLKRVD